MEEIGNQAFDHDKDEAVSVKDDKWNGKPELQIEDTMNQDITIDKIASNEEKGKGRREWERGSLIRSQRHCKKCGD